jgi:CRISPR/Cas system-associated exonuclease Cas4 (RecB family)
MVIAKMIRVIQIHTAMAALGTAKIQVPVGNMMEMEGPLLTLAALVRDILITHMIIIMEMIITITMVLV